jgi:hypothetical protein
LESISTISLINIQEIFGDCATPRVRKLTGEERPEMDKKFQDFHDIPIYPSNVRIFSLQIDATYPLGEQATNLIRLQMHSELRSTVCEYRIELEANCPAVYPVKSGWLSHLRAGEGSLTFNPVILQNANLRTPELAERFSTSRDRDA